MSLTVRDTLKLEIFKDACILAGKDGMDNQIRWVNVLEVLDETSLLQPGELLLTTAYGLKSDTQLQERLVPELANLGLAGLIIQVGHYLNEIPPEMCLQADELGFPLIQLPKNISFASVTQAVNRQIINRQIDVLEYTGQIHARLTGLVLEGGGLQGVGEALASLTGNPVRIVDPFFRLVACAATEDTSEKAVDRQFQALARMGLLDTASLEKKPLQVREMAVHHIPDQYIFPILAGESLLAYISVLENNVPLSDPARIAVSQAAALCGLEMLKSRAVRETENRLKGDFLDDLLGEIPVSPAAIKKRALYLGYDMNREQIVLLLYPDDSRQLNTSCTEKEILEIKRKLAGVVELVVEQTASRFIYKYRHDTLVLLLQVPPGVGGEHGVKLALKLQAHAAVFLPSLTLSIGIGQPYARLQELRRSYQEAVWTLEVIQATGRKNAVLQYRDLGIYRLLVKLQDDPELAAFYQFYLNPLAEYDRRHDSQLVKTLRFYFKYHGNLKEVSAEMFIHRHTLKYRLSRIQEISGLDLRDPDHRLALQTALKVLPLLSRDQGGPEPDRKKKVRRDSPI